MEPANSGEIMQTASELNEGQLSTVVPTPDGSVIVYVTKRLPIDDNQLKAEKGRLAEALSNFQRMALFQEWLKLRRASSNCRAISVDSRWWSVEGGEQGEPFSARPPVRIPRHHES